MPGQLTTTFVSLITFFVATNTDIGVSCFTVGSTHGIKSHYAVSPLRKRTSLRETVAGIGGEDFKENDEPVQYIRGGGLASNLVGRWPSLDAVDDRLIKIGLPCILNFAIVPLVGAVDLFWVNRMGNPLAVAGQSAANQVFNSAFWLASFLPSGTFSGCGGRNS
jgi:hypothetical protein